MGGVLAAIAAPQLFNALYEFPLLLVLGMMCRPGVLARHDPGEARRLTYATLATGAVVLGLGAAVRSGGFPQAPSTRGWLSSYSARPSRCRRRSRRASRGARCTRTVPDGAAQSDEPRRGGAHLLRDHRVELAEGGQLRLLVHGTTLHGSERIRTPEGAPVHEPRLRPTIMRAARLHAASNSRAARPGRAVPISRWYRRSRRRLDGLPRATRRDVAVLRNRPRRRAHRPRSGTLPLPFPLPASRRHRCRRCPVDTRQETERGFSYLVIDAFASDAVPTHLLTREALQLFLDRLDEKGILAMHVSNRHMDLIAVAVRWRARPRRGRGVRRRQRGLIGVRQDAIARRVRRQERRPAGARADLAARLADRRRRRRPWTTTSPTSLPRSGASTR